MERTHLILLPGILCDDCLWMHQIEKLNDIASIDVGNLTKDVSSPLLLVADLLIRKFSCLLICI
jgi:hypothetical protein